MAATGTLNRQPNWGIWIGVVALLLGTLIVGQIWNDLARNRHAINEHGAEFVRCVAKMFDKVGKNSTIIEILLSQEPTIGTGPNKFMAVAFAADADKLFGWYRKTGEPQGPCDQIDDSYFQNHFGRENDPDYAMTKMRLVAVFGRDVYMKGSSLQEDLFSVSAYPVPKVDWKRWRCEWKFTTQLFPGPIPLPC